MKEIPGFELSLDIDNPETPKLVNPATGQAQRATYTDVLLFLLIDRIDTLIGQGKKFATAPEKEPSTAAKSTSTRKKTTESS